MDRIVDKGVFEIHITVDEKDIFPFQLFCNENRYESDFAVGPWIEPQNVIPGSSNTQLMLTHMYSGTFKEALKKSDSIAINLKKYGINVKRQKIEIPANSKLVHEFINELFHHIHIGYFEFHFKVQLTSQEQFKKLLELSRKHESSFSYNAFGKTKEKVLMTMRVKSSSFESAQEYRKKFIEILEEEGFLVNRSGSGTHYEYVVLDTNFNLDSGFVPYYIKV